MKTELEKRYEQFEPEELLLIVNLPDEYTPEAVYTANAELLRRKMPLQKLLSSDKLSGVDLVRMGLKTDRKGDISFIQEELKRRRIWEGISRYLQTECRQSTQKILDEILPEGIRFNEKFEELLSSHRSAQSEGEKVNIIVLLFQHIAKNMINGETSGSIFLRLNEIGVDSNILFGLMEPCYLRIESALSKQKPAAKSYLQAIFAGFASAIIGGLCYGYYMLNTDSKLNYVLILLGVFSGLAIHFVTRGKKSTAIMLIGIFSTVLAIVFGNLVYALYRNVAMPLTGFDFIWGIIGITFVVGISHRIQIRRTRFNSN